jgi:hypothetical protein
VCCHGTPLSPFRAGFLSHDAPDDASRVPGRPALQAASSAPGRASHSASRADAGTSSQADPIQAKFGFEVEMKVLLSKHVDTSRNEESAYGDPGALYLLGRKGLSARRRPTCGRRSPRATSASCSAGTAEPDGKQIGRASIWIGRAW